MTSIRINRNGLRNLADLRAMLAKDDNRSVYRQGHDWIISQWSPGYGCTVEYTANHDDTEREAIERAIGLIPLRYHII